MLPKSRMLEHWQNCEADLEMLAMIENPSNFEEWLTQTEFGMEVYERLMSGSYGRGWDALAGFFEQCEDVGQLGLIALWKRFDKADPNYLRVLGDRNLDAGYLAMWAACRGRDTNIQARRRHSWKVEVASEPIEEERREYVAPKEAHVIYRPTEDEALANLEEWCSEDERVQAINEAIEIAKVATTNNLKMYPNLDIVVEALKQHSVLPSYNESVLYYRAVGMSYYTYCRWKARLLPHLKQEIINRFPHLA